ncbi:MAG: hypothetical protein PF795_04020 [Kiritimatiellae bacterium]|jgi:hypothetical protein|nr:hypothetical protein [Kiritimatiellia bacterium]
MKEAATDYPNRQSLRLKGWDYRSPGWYFVTIRSGEVIMSGFLSPMERALFRAGLRDGKAMIWVKPWGLNAEKESPRVREAVEAGTLLVLSPFDEKLDAPAARRAVWCNQFVMERSERIVIGHLNPTGMLACVVSELDPEKKVTLLS